MSVDQETRGSISTPDRVETRLGSLEFTDGAPSPQTLEKLYDHLGFLHGVNAYLNAFPAASTAALRKGFQSLGAEDNSIVIFSELMDSQSLFLTANAPDGPGHHRRHVVPLDHRLRPARPRPG